MILSINALVSIHFNNPAWYPSFSSWRVPHFWDARACFSFSVLIRTISHKEKKQLPSITISDGVTGDYRQRQVPKCWHLWHSWLGLSSVFPEAEAQSIISNLHLLYLSSSSSALHFLFPILITLQQILETIWPGQRAELSSTNSFSTGSVSCCVHRDTWLVPFERTKGKGAFLIALRHCCFELACLYF